MLKALVVEGSGTHSVLPRVIILSALREITTIDFVKEFYSAGLLNKPAQPSGRGKGAACSHSKDSP